MTSRLAVFTYHYLVDPEEPLQRSILGPSRAAFAAQVEFLARRHPLVAPAALGEFFAGRGQGGTSVLFTFDDGLREHLGFAAGVLEEHGARGIFFAPSCLLRGEPVPAVALHYSLALLRLGPTVELLNWILAERGAAERFSLAAGEKATAAISRLKAFVRSALPYALRAPVLADLFRQGAAREHPDLFTRIFMTPDDLRDLERRGHLVGGHTDSHPSFADLDLDLAGPREITAALEALARELGRPVRTFAYPFGAQQADAGPVRSRLRRAGVDLAFTTERALNTPATDPLAIGRYSVYGDDTPETLERFAQAAA